MRSMRSAGGATSPSIVSASRPREASAPRPAATTRPAEPKLSTSAAASAAPSPGASARRAQASVSSSMSGSAVPARQKRNGRRPRGRRPLPCLASGGVTYYIVHPHLALRRHDESVGDAVVHLEHHHVARRLVRQLHLLAAEQTEPARPGKAVTHRLAGRQHAEHVAGRQPVAGAAVDDDDLVLPDQRNTIYYRDDAAVYVRIRRLREEIQRNLDLLAHQAVAGQRLPAGLQEMH